MLRAVFEREPFRLAHCVLVMGLSGLSLLLLRVKHSFLAWGLAPPTTVIEWMAACSACIATAVFFLLCGAFVLQTVVRIRFSLSAPQAGPGRPPVPPSQLALEISSIPGLSASAALAVGMVLLSSVWLQWGYPGASAVLWCLGASLEGLLSVVVFYRVMRAYGREGFWPTITPALLIPAVGNALVVLAGLPLGFDDWCSVQFWMGSGLWPLVWGLLVMRQMRHGALPAAMRPTWCIVLSPPSVVGLGLLSWQLASGVSSVPTQAWAMGAWGCWVLAAVSLWQIKPHVRAILSTPFGMSHWALSFPFAAYASLTWALFARLLDEFGERVFTGETWLGEVWVGMMGFWAGALLLTVLLILSLLSHKTIVMVLNALLVLNDTIKTKTT